MCLAVVDYPVHRHYSRDTIRVLPVKHHTMAKGMGVKKEKKKPKKTSGKK